MITFMARPVMLVLAIILLTTPGANAAKKLFLDGLVGSWKGSGFVTTSPGVKEEAIRCRLKNRMDKKNPKINLTGSCGIGGVLIPMNGWIQRSGKSKKYTASLFKSLGFLRIDSFKGALKGAKLDLRFKGKDKVNKEEISASIVIHVKNSSRFDIQLTTTDPKTRKRHHVGTIKFKSK